MPEEDKKEQKEEDPSVILRADMHCNACQHRINKVLKNFPGVEKVDMNVPEQKVIVKGKVDAKSVFEAIKKKCGKRTVLVYPQLPKDDEQKKEDGTEKPKDDHLPDVIVELKVKMHCGACAKEVKKMLLKVNGVAEVYENVATEKVVVKGKALNPEELCERVRKTGKFCQVIQPPHPQNNEKKEEEAKGEAKETEEKKEELKEEKREESGGGEAKLEVKRMVYPHYHTIHQYVYAPQLFSEENPNACMVM